MTPLADGQAPSSWLFYLSDVDSQSELGTLHARNVAGDDLVLGVAADERYAAVAADGTTGYAVVDVAAERGRLIHWTEGGGIETLATDVLIGARPRLPVEPRAAPANSWNSIDEHPLRGDGDHVLSGFDDPTGALGVLQQGTLRPVTTGVPARGR